MLVALPAWVAGARLPERGFPAGQPGRSAGGPGIDGTRFLRNRGSYARPCSEAGCSSACSAGPRPTWCSPGRAAARTGGGPLRASRCSCSAPRCWPTPRRRTLDLTAPRSPSRTLRASFDCHLETPLARARCWLRPAPPRSRYASKFSSDDVPAGRSPWPAPRSPGTVARRLRGAAWRGSRRWGCSPGSRSARSTAGESRGLADRSPPPAARRPARASGASRRAVLPLPPELVLGLDDALAYARHPRAPGHRRGHRSARAAGTTSLEAFASRSHCRFWRCCCSRLCRDLGPRVEAGHGRQRCWLPPLAILGPLARAWYRVQYGLRYALPLYPFLFVAAGRRVPVRGRGRPGRRPLGARRARVSGATPAPIPMSCHYFN